MPQSNQRVGEYILDRKLGGGGFGEVWLAHHHVWTDRQVAMKMPTDPQYVRGLQREGSAVHGLVHPNIVRALGFDPYGQTPYLTMEYVPGTSLRPLIQDKALRIVDAVAILRAVLAGLKYAHEQGIVHRDIKPENILIHERSRVEGYDAPGVVKVTDFGLGQAAGAASMGSIALSMSLSATHAREIAGTLDYMSPEQRAGEAIDARADLYACGVVLYEMLTGERPAGTDVPGDLVPDVPAAIDEVFRRLYARLDRRFTTVDQVLAALAPHAPPPLPGAALTAPGAPISPSPMGHRVCPQCRHGVEAADQFCMNCGMQLVASVRRCGQCGAYPEAHDRFCIFCGHELHQGVLV